VRRERKLEALVACWTLVEAEQEPVANNVRTVLLFLDAS
jgi:hypothetical protein